MRDRAPSANRGYTTRHPIRVALLASAALCLVIGAGMSVPAHAQTAHAQTIPLNIRSQDLGSALTAFADRAGLRLLFPSSLVAGRASPALSGAFTREEALSRLLSGTGLSYSFTNANTVTITDRMAAAHEGNIGGDGLLLPTINVVSEGKAASFTSDTPLATQTTSEDIAKREISDLKQLGNTTEPGLNYVSESEGPVLRGQDGPRVLTTVDDIAIPHLENYARRYSKHNGDGGSSAFDFSSISMLDILHGADSSKIGGGALGGAIVMRTLEPDDLIEEGRDWGAVTKLTYDSRNASLSGSFAGAARHEATSVLLQGAYTAGGETRNQGKVGGYGLQRTKANPADLDQNNLLFKIRHQLEGGHSIGLTAERFDRRLDVDDRSSWNLGPAAYTIVDYTTYDALRRERVSLDYAYEAEDGDALVQSAFARFYWQDVTKSAGERHYRDYSGYMPSMSHHRQRDNELHQTNIGVVGGVSGRFSTGSLEHDWRMGLDATALKAGGYVYVDPPTYAAVSQADMPDVEGFKVGAYVEDRIGLGDSNFTLTPGIRLDWHDYTPRETPEFLENPGYDIYGMPPAHDGFQVSPKILVSYEADPRLQFFAQWSSAYRVPTVNELYLNFSNPALGYAVKGNPDLESETGNSIEIGVNAGDESFGGRIVAFNTNYKNYIVEADHLPDPNNPWMTLFTFENLDRARISGLEAKVHKRFESGFLLHGALSYAYGRDLDNDKRLRNVAPLKAIVGVGYERESWGLGLTGVFSAKMPDDGTNTTFDAPSYAIANVSAWWEPQAVKGLRIQAGINNLFDTTYFEALEWRRSVDPGSLRDLYSEPGRTFTLSATMRF